jgi:hypothetical protein
MSDIVPFSNGRLKNLVKRASYLLKYKKVSTYTGFKILVVLSVKINVLLGYDAVLFDRQSQQLRRT